MRKTGMTLNEDRRQTLKTLQKESAGDNSLTILVDFLGSDLFCTPNGKVTVTLFHDGTWEVRSR